MGKYIAGIISGIVTTFLITATILSAINHDNQFHFNKSGIELTGGNISIYYNQIDKELVKSVNKNILNIDLEDNEKYILFMDDMIEAFDRFNQIDDTWNTTFDNNELSFVVLKIKSEVLVLNCVFNNASYVVNIKNI